MKDEDFMQGAWHEAFILHPSRFILEQLIASGSYA
jgi:hypothetical protein